MRTSPIFEAGYGPVANYVPVALTRTPVSGNRFSMKAFAASPVGGPCSDHFVDLGFEVSLTEVPRALGRIGSPPRAIDRYAVVLEHVRLLKADRRIFRRAAQMDPPSLRALDAIHLASALAIGDALGAFITYDHQQATAAALTGLRVETPGVGGSI